MNFTSIQAVQDAQLCRFARYSRLALAIWDLVLSMGCEVDAIWRPKCHFLSFLYLVSRYPVVAYSMWTALHRDADAQLPYHRHVYYFIFIVSDQRCNDHCIPIAIVYKKKSAQDSSGQVVSVHAICLDGDTSEHVPNSCCESFLYGLSNELVLA
ncbi:hypothetical protein CONPUDRAFT_135954 [Coniophora puteana RWD-64-598 SS2]|uniref:DUF6533 domain-containing protein n=1 Tax=Coniophora puteana (strain RWD-64-598) TaxID=741705 RepID=A0A5M3MTU5_CONPW|nr:uncharacterized protein CONPUDRAFT_135954 [Coniophora puteana RWD-64-598 SS2]EIW82578.1 hypothetical protein CONPUDRAFT_135954 [Coniophora puteana RWD-64-598 SS2]